MITELLNNMPTGFKVIKVIDWGTFKSILRHKGYNYKEVITSLYKESNMKFKKSNNILTISKIGLLEYFIDLAPFKEYLSKKRKKFNSKNVNYITIKVDKSFYDDFKELLWK